MDLLTLLLAKKLNGGGGGGEVTVQSLNVTSNGTYTAPSNKAYSPVNVNVPNSYTQSDEGKVVNSGALVTQTSQSISSNGTYDTTLKNEVVVDVKDSAYEKMHGLYDTCFQSEDLPAIINFKNVTHIGTRALRYATGIRILVFPSVSQIGSYPLADINGVEAVDLGANHPNITVYYFSGDWSVATLILRKGSVVSLAALNALDRTPFASNRPVSYGGTLYVPQSLISSYQSATNWSTILADAKNQILPIEGSIYENAYADGTPIS